jgi:hypothetical protein
MTKYVMRVPSGLSFRDGLLIQTNPHGFRVGKSSQNRTNTDAPRVAFCARSMKRSRALRFGSPQETEKILR